MNEFLLSKTFSKVSKYIPIYIIECLSSMIHIPTF